MKYSEFEREVEKLGLTCTKGNGEVKVRLFGKTVTGVSEIRELIFDNEWSEFQSLGKQTQTRVFDLAYQLAKTPRAEREEEKLYRLQKIPVPLLDKEGEKKWLWKYTGTVLSNVFGVDTIRVGSKLYQTIFTESEIAEMDIAGFEKVEVEE